jgi:hypothetical protein
MAGITVLLAAVTGAVLLWRFVSYLVRLRAHRARFSVLPGPKHSM